MMTNTIKVNRKDFIKNYRNAKKQRGLSTMKVAKQAHLTPSYTYHVTSPKNKRPLIGKTVLKIGRGLGMPPKEASNWLKSIINYEKHDANSKDYSLSQLTEEAMKQNNMSANDLSKTSGLNIDYIKKLLDAKELVKTSKMDLARLANSLKLNVDTLEKAKGISLDKYKKDQEKSNNIKKDKDSKLVHKKNNSLLKFLKKRDKKDQKRRAKNSNNVTQHVNTGHVSIGNSNNPFSLNKTTNTNTQPAKFERNPFLNGDRLNVQVLESTAEQLNDMDISLLNMIAQRLLQAEMHENHTN